MNSISVRLLLAAALLMTVFIGATTLAIQRTVDQRAQLALQDRLLQSVNGCFPDRSTRHSVQFSLTDLQ